MTRITGTWADGRVLHLRELTLGDLGTRDGTHLRLPLVIFGRQRLSRLDRLFQVGRFRGRCTWNGLR